MLLVDGAFLVYAIYVPFLIALYALEILVIFKHRKQQTTGSFHRIFSVLAAVNIQACLLGSFVFRISLYPIANGFYRGMKGGWLTYIVLGAYYFNCLSECLGVLQALNRFTALHFAMRHDQFWRWAFVVGISLCILVSVPPNFILLNNEDMFVESSSTNITNYTWYHLYAKSDIPQTTIWINMLIVSVTCNALSFILYIACLIRLCLFSVKRNSTMERNFFLVGFLNMIFSLPYMGTMIYYYLIPTMATIDARTAIFLTFQLPWLTDLKLLSPAPMLLITNRAIRKNIKSLLLKRIASMRIISMSDTTHCNIHPVRLVSSSH